MADKFLIKQMALGYIKKYPEDKTVPEAVVTPSDRKKKYSVENLAIAEGTLDTMEIFCKEFAVILQKKGEKNLENTNNRIRITNYLIKAISSES